MFSGQPIGSSPIADFGDLPTPDDTFVRLLQSPNLATRYLVDIVAAPRNARAPTPGPMPIGWGPLAAINGINTEESQFTTLTVSDGYYTTKPSDDLRPNLSAKDRLADRISIERSIPINPLSARRSQTQFGEIPILNDDGFMDDFIEQYTAKGRLVRVLFGPAQGEFKEFRSVAEVYGDSWDTSRKIARLSVQDISFQLNAEFSNLRYQGTGLQQGDAKLEGQSKPRGIGHIYNASPVLESAINRVYGFNVDRNTNAVDEVRDAGVPLTYSGTDVSTYEDLLSEPVQPGTYITQLNAGRLKLGSDPAGSITMDFRGEEFDGFYMNDTGSLLFELARQSAGISTDFLDRNSFSGLSSWEVGYYFGGGSSPTIADVFNALCAPLNAVWGSLTNSKLSVFQVKAPEDLPDGATITHDQVIDMEEVQLNVLPASYGSMTWRPNWTVQSTDSLSGSLSAAQKNLFATSSSQGGDLAEFFSTEAITVYGDTQKLENLISYFWEKTHTEIALGEFQRLWNTERRLFRIIMPRVGLLYNLGSAVKLTYPRFGFDDGKNALIVTKVERYDENKVELMVMR